MRPFSAAAEAPSFAQAIEAEFCHYCRLDRPVVVRAAGARTISVWIEQDGRCCAVGRLVAAAHAEDEARLEGDEPPEGGGLVALGGGHADDVGDVVAFEESGAFGRLIGLRQFDEARGAGEFAPACEEARGGGDDLKAGGQCLGEGSGALVEGDEGI